MIFKKFKYLHIYLPSIFIIWLALFIDSKTISSLISHNQYISNIIVIATFIYLYRNVTVKIRKIMLYGVFLGLAGETLFALILGMYSYRLENLPIYVPFGHSIVYVIVFYIAKEKLVKINYQSVIKYLYIFMTTFSTYWFIIKDDTFGFICFLFIVYLFYKKPQMRLFYLIMYCMVLYLELVGTYYNCWVWPETWFGKIDFISSANPPSSISLFYFGFDLGCLWIYKKLNSKKWNRMKNIKRIRACK
ncbi:hypothetical protein GCM10012288_12100 [Malaciobacter pacificus]|uniref:Uncharacterized protein n=1 Tax=Malaciobacter pacificus TaxID=1080223 RepID=A0A5C2HD01_9BACT|nr:hypothetical protein [Malaciobacter pacificus]QEP34202.1 hypothetical protein APAC_1076 [Malaciobacter pacificus]GGD39665.1 hypothetical protein GCM10012288_12100 [Malaciobacter pacificus]